MIIKYLKLYDEPVKKAAFDTFLTVFFCVLWPTWYVLSNVLIEYLGFPWQLTCFIETPCDIYDWFKDRLIWLLDFLISYGPFIAVVITTICFAYCYLKRKISHTFVIRILFDKAVTPIFLTYFMAVLVNALLHVEPFERLKFLEQNWEPILSSSGLSFLGLLIFCWFVMSFAVNKQSKILETKRKEQDKKSITDRIHDFRRMVIEEFDS